MNRHNMWKDEDIYVVQRMYFSGSTDPQISVVVGRTVSAVSNLRKRMGFLQDKADRPKFIRKPPTFQPNPKDPVLSCREHLIDLLRDSGMKTLGEAKARYRQANELDVPEAYTYRMVTPWRDARSLVGTQFADAG